MSDSPVVAAIVHDLAGMLSNVSAFAGILENKPDHPGRAEFLPVLAKEARSAAEAVKDLQLARSLSTPWPRSDLSSVSVRSLLVDVAGRLGRPDWFTGPAERIDDVGVTADEGVLAALLTRAVEFASAGDTTRESPLDLEQANGAVLLKLDLSRTSYDGDVLADVERGRRELRAFALLRGCVESWGGDGTVQESDGAIHMVLRLPSSA